MINREITSEKRARCRIIVLISGRGTNLQALINEAPRLGFTIDLIVSSKASALGLERAKKHQIPFKILEHQFFVAGFSCLRYILHRFYNHCEQL